MKKCIRTKMEQAAPYQKKWITGVEQFIIERIDEPYMTIGDIAHSFALSERQFHRKVKRILGITPNTFIRQIKMETAMSLIETGAHSTVKEISYAVGFKRSDYFSNIFEEHFGKRPLEYLISSSIQFDPIYGCTFSNLE